MTLCVSFNVLLAIGFVVLYVLSIYLKYRKSSYKNASGNSFRRFSSSIKGTTVFLIFPAREKGKDITDY